MDTHAILEKVGNGPPFLEVLSMDKIQYPSQNEDQFQHIVGSRESQTVNMVKENSQFHHSK